MERNFVPVPLFGGAMKVDIPEGFVDISDMRQVPDHQEVFASNVTQTNIIIEITERVERDAWEPPAEAPGSLRAPTDPNVDNEKAVLYHVDDLCGENRDTYEIVNAPKIHPSPRINAPTLSCKVLVGTKQTASRPSAQGTPDTAGETQAATIHVFVVRLVEQKADILVHVNVPHAELQDSGDPDAVPTEEAFAQQIMYRMAQTLEILDYDLFG